jgi:ankyrin repeat protein
LTLDDSSPIGDAAVRRELLEFFTHASAHVVNQGPITAPAPLDGELAPLWDEQLALDEAVALMRSPDQRERCIALLQSPVLRARFARSPAVHASVIALAATTKIPLLREYAIDVIRANRSLVHERYKGRRTLLHDAAAAGDVSLVEQLLDMGAGDLEDGQGRSPLYCVGNECRAPGGGQIDRVLLQRGAARVNAVHGAKRCTALHMAARRGNVDVIGALLDGGADIEVRDSVGDTPLRRAVNLNKVEAAKLLLGRGANPHSKGSRSLTPAGAARSGEMKQLFSGVKTG